MDKIKPNNKQLQELLEKALENKLSEEEAAFLEAWDDYQTKNGKAFEELSKERRMQIKSEMWEVIRQDRIIREPKTRIQRSWPLFMKYAAVLALVIGVAIWIFVLKDQDISYPSKLVVESENLELPIDADLPPGSYQAILRLDNQRQVALSSAHEGIVMGERIAYQDGSVLADVSLEYVAELSLETPRGGTYQVTLPDGTKVWLNADTKLKYPERFAGDSRTVELEGEAYFEVVKDVKPFYVKTGTQTIRVLGTSFNISAYAEDYGTVTTLVSGMVRINHLDSGGEVTLNPGQQAWIQNGMIMTKEVEVTDYLAWKNGFFIFRDTPLAQIIKQLQRWYNFQTVEGDIPQIHFNGAIARDVPLSEVLIMLHATSTAVDFEIKNGALVVRSL